jgi:threonine aldolase
MAKFNRRSFLKSSALAAIPSLSIGSAFANSKPEITENFKVSDRVVFRFDGAQLSPMEYLNKLQQINSESPIQMDSYGKGGVVEALEKKFAEITGKEKAIYMPTGTLANQLAIAALSGDQPKVIVQDISHINRDEADVNLVYNKQLVPLADNKTYFTAAELEDKIKRLPSEEYFYSGIGAVSIENPVRRAFGEYIPFDELKAIKKVYDAQSIKMHLDAARIYIASAWSGVSIKEYSSLFDTVYISLYKYFGANGGAILCGDANLLDELPRQIKIHGRNIQANWENAAMALHALDTIEQNWKDVKNSSDELLAALELMPRVSIRAKKNSTNIYFLRLPENVQIEKISARLSDEFNIQIYANPNSKDLMLMMNETLLNQSLEKIIQAFKVSISQS